MKLSQYYSLNISKIKYYWQKYLLQTGTIVALLSLSLSLILGTFWYNNLISTTTNDGVNGKHWMFFVSNILNPTLPKNLIYTSNSINTTKEDYKVICGYQMISPLIILNQQKDKLAIPCFASPQLYNDFAMDQTNSSLNRRQDSLIPILVPSSWILPNRSDSRLYQNYTKEQLVNYKQQLIKSNLKSDLSILPPANNEEIELFSQVQTSGTNDLIDTKLNSFLDTRIGQSQKSNLDFVIVGLINNTSKNTKMDAVILPDWFLDDNKSSILTNNLINFVDYRIYKFNTESQKNSFQNQLSGFGGDWQTPSIGLIRNFESQKNLVYLLIFVVLVLTIAIIALSFRQTYQEDSKSNFLMKMLGMTQKQLWFLFGQRVFMILLVSLVVSVIISILINTIVISQLKDIIFGVIKPSSSNPTFLLEDIKLI